MIVSTVIIHVFCLLLITEKVDRVRSEAVGRNGSTGMFTVIIGTVALLATMLHGAEGVIWAASHRLVGALPDSKSAVLYSLSAITSFGHANVCLAPRWQLVGALEALNGMLLFGLTTAFLFAVVQRDWGLRKARSHEKSQIIVSPEPSSQSPTCR